MKSGELEAIAQSLASQAPAVGVDGIVVIAMHGSEAYAAVVTRLPGGTRTALRIALDVVADAATDDRPDCKLPELS